jgi:hypothetical protein
MNHHAGRIFDRQRAADANDCDRAKQGVAQDSSNPVRVAASSGDLAQGFRWRLQMKLMVIPVGNSLVFSGSQKKNISYSTDHRQ